nr:hypothetical protein [Pseudomonas sp. PB120]
MAFFLRCVGTADCSPGPTRRRHSVPMGWRWAADPDNFAHRCKSHIQLQRLRQGHRRAR